jgi:hypothetical protein
MKADQEEVLGKMETNQEGMEAKIEVNSEKFDVLRENMCSSQEEKETQIGALVSRVDDRRPWIWRRFLETEAAAANEEVGNEEAALETIRALNDRSGDRCLAVRRRGLLTLRAVPARRKGSSYKGPTVDKRSRVQPECNNSIRDRGLNEQL